MHLSAAQIDLLIRLVEEYQEKTDDLSQREWAEAQATLDVLDEMLERVDG